MLGRRAGADQPIATGELRQSIRLLIFTRLWAKTPWPHQVRVPVSPSRRVRLSPKSRLTQLIRPSHPVRHRTILRNARLFSTWRRAAVGLPLVGSTMWRTGDAQIILDARFAVAAIGRHRPRRASGRLLDPLDRRRQHRRVGRVTRFDVAIDDDTVLVVDELRLV